MFLILKFIAYCNWRACGRTLRAPYRIPRSGPEHAPDSNLCREFPQLAAVLVWLSKFLPPSKSTKFGEGGGI